MSLSDERLAKFERVVNNRQFDLTIILENVHDPHNIGAVLRSCDSVGVHEIYIVHTEAHLQAKKLEVGINSASGARKWVDVHYFHDLDLCFKAVREKYKLIFSTKLDEDSKDLYEIDFTQSVALLFGNEKDGVSPDAQKLVDGNFKIPQMGMIESLNISVACAVSLYEALRQRSLRDLYGEGTNPTKKSSLLAEYKRRHLLHLKRNSFPLIDGAD